MTPHLRVLSKPARKGGFFPDGSSIEIRYNPTSSTPPPQYGHNNRPFTLKSLEKFLKDAITGEDTGHATYAEMYPEINKPNTFSISTLAFDNYEFPPMLQQILWKTSGKQEETPDSSLNMRMFRGKAIHEYFQERLVQRSIDWEREVEVRLHLPYAWKNLRNEDGTPCTDIILMGHADAVNFVTHEILEFKTSDYSGNVSEYMARQGGIYAGIMTDYFSVAFKMTVVKIIGKETCLGCNHAAKSHQRLPTGEVYCIPRRGECYCDEYQGGIMKLVQPDVAQVSDSVAEMIDRCYNCAKILDEGYYANKAWVDDPEYAVWKEACEFVASDNESS